METPQLLEYVKALVNAARRAFNEGEVENCLVHLRALKDVLNEHLPEAAATGEPAESASQT